MTAITAILFDLGGVLVDFTGVEAARRLARTDPGADAAKALWGESTAIQDFEHGRVDADAFARAFVREWDLAISPETFLPMFATWVSGPRPGVADLLADLRGRYAVACFSNTNPIHWRRMAVDHGLLDRLDHAYASFEIGMMKPRPEAFAHVAADMGRRPDEVLFFDDGAGNVAGARAAGFEAEQAAGVDDLKRLLAARGLV